MIDHPQPADELHLRHVAGCILLFLMFLSGRALTAQVDRGAIVGKVADPTRAMMAQATVTLSEEQTNVKQNTVTGKNGEYLFFPVRLGVCSVAVEKQGYKTTTQQHVEVTPQASLEVNIPLEWGAVSENVELSVAAPILESHTSSLQRLVDTETVNAALALVRFGNGASGLDGLILRTEG